MTDGTPPRDRSAQADWENIRARLRAELGNAVFASWLSPLTLVDVNDKEISLGVATQFLRDWVETHYADRIAALWAEHRPSIQGRVRIVVHNGPPAEADSKPSAAGKQLNVFDSPLNGRFTFREFVVGESNKLAHAAAQQVASADHLPFNPLYLYGSVGNGKTHLLHAIAWHIRDHEPSRRVLYLSAERFMYRFIQAIRKKDTIAFKERLRSADVLLIDDIQFICDKDSTQEEFLHTLDALFDHHCQVVVSADRPPGRLEGMRERLKSRLTGGLAVDILPANYKLRLGILSKKARPLGITDVSSEVLEFLARNITTNTRELEMALNRIAAHVALIGGTITLQTVQWVLRDVLEAKEQKITIEDIQRRVAAHYNVRLAELSSNRRSQAVVRPRHVAIYLARQLTSRSLPEIGRKFGRRDHTTVLYAIRRIEELRLKDPALDEDVGYLWRSLGEPDR